jgi:hypothetical protein
MDSAMTATTTSVPLPLVGDELAAWTSVNAGDWKWLVHPDVGDVLQQHFDGDNASSIIIKQGPHRTIRQLDTPAGAFFFKQFHQPDWSTAFRHWIRGGQARWEYSRYRLAIRRDIPTAEVVAIGRTQSWNGESGVITRGIADVTPLDQWISTQADSLNLAQRRRLSMRLAELLARMHRSGAIHRDLHTGNLLLREDGGDLRLWVIDLSPMRFRSTPADWAALGENLGRLRHSSLRYLSSSDQAAFCRTYLREFFVDQPLTPSNRRWMLRELLGRCDAVARQCWNQMDRKWSRGNRKVIILKTPTVHVRGIATLGRETLRRICESPAELQQLPIRIQTHQTPLSRRKPTVNGWARHGWEIGHALHRRLISVPVPVCMVEQFAGDNVIDSLAFTQDDGWECLSGRGISASGKIIDEIGRRVVDLLRRLHEFGFSHLALLMASLEFRSQDSGMQVRLCQLENVQQSGTVPDERRWEELSSLAADVASQIPISLTMWLRWLKRYLGRAEAAHWKTDWRAITASMSRSSLRRAA